LAKKRFNLYELFNPSRDARGVQAHEWAEEYRKLGFKFYFKLLGRNIGRLISINLLYVFGNFPLIFGLLAFSGLLNNTSMSPVSPLYGVLRGVWLLDGGKTPAFSAMLGIHGLQTTMSYTSTATIVMWCLSGLVLITWGPVNVGCTHLLRSIVRGEPIFMMSDFFSAIRRNLKQSFIFGVLDIVFMALLAYDVVFFYFNIGSFMFNVMFYFSLFMVIMYFFMRFYMYLMLITFELSTFKIIKNSLIFSFIGLGQNFLALLGIAFLVFLFYSLLIIYVPIGIILPFTILFAVGAYTSCYAAYGKIKAIMIDPYANDEDEKDKEEPIFRDSTV